MKTKRVKTQEDDGNNQLNPFLVDEEKAARACGIGKTLFRQLDKDGSLPEPCRLHSRKVWSLRQLAIWSILGCPSRNSDIWREKLKSFHKTPEKYL